MYRHGNSNHWQHSWWDEERNRRERNEDGPPKVRKCHRSTKITVYSLVSIFFICCAAGFVISSDRSEQREEQINLARAPRWSEQQIIAAGQTILDKMHTGESSVDDHFRTLRLRDQYYWAYRLAEKENRTTTAMRKVNVEISTNTMLTNNVGQSLRDDHKREWNQALDIYNTEDTPKMLSSNTQGYDVPLLFLKIMAVGGIPFVFCCFLIWTYERGGKVFAEMAFPRIWFYAVIWPVGLFKFTKGLNPQAQWQRARHFASLVFSSVLTFGGAGALAQSNANSNSERGANHSYVIDANTMGFNRYVLGNGALAHDGPISQTTVTVSWKNGFWVGTSLTEPFQVLAPVDFGTEVDAYVGYGLNFHGFRIGEQIQWIGLAPLASIRSDIADSQTTISRTYQLSKKQALTPSLLFQIDNPVRGSTPRAGWLVKPTLQHNWQVWSRYNLNSGLSIYHDSGLGSGVAGWTASATTVGQVQLNKRFGIIIPAVKLSHTVVNTPNKDHTSFGFGLAYHFE